VEQSKTWEYAVISIIAWNREKEMPLDVLSKMFGIDQRLISQSNNF
jgi:hypothetical protein